MTLVYSIMSKRCHLFIFTFPCDLDSPGWIRSLYEMSYAFQKSSKTEVTEHPVNQSTPIAQSNIVGSSDGKKTKKPKTRKFLNRGRSLDQCETSESETESDISRSVPNKPPRRKNRNRNTSSGSDLDSSQAPTKALKGILKKQNSVEKPPSSESIAAKRLTMRRGSSVDSALPPSTQFSGKVFKGLTD